MPDSRFHTYKLKPFADAIRAQIEEIQPLQGRILVFNGWTPTPAWYHYLSRKTKRVYSVKNHKGRVYVFRLE